MSGSAAPMSDMPRAARLALRLALLTLAFIVPRPGLAQETAQGLIVDVELVLAVDASWSMDYGEQLIQRDGYAGAFRSEEVVEAILFGGYGRVAVAYVEWAGADSQQVIVPWTLIDSEAAALGFADALEQGGPQNYRRTSISGAIDFATSLFDDNGFEGLRRIVDISGDGPNNQGRSVTAARDAAVEAGITINGLPLMTNEPGFGLGYAIPHLDLYFAECVIGGGQAFMLPVRSWEEFPMAVRRKLVLELAGRELEGSSSPTGAKAAGDPLLHLAQVTQEAAKTDCLIGEKLWQQRRGNWVLP